MRMLRATKFTLSSSCILLVAMKWKLLNHVWLYNLMDYTVHEILQASILEWVAVPFSRESSQPRDRTQVTRIAGGFFTIWATRGAPISGRTKTKSWIFSFLCSLFFFCIILSYFNSTHFKALNTFLSSPFFTHQMDSFTLLLAAATKYWYHLYTIQGLLLLLSRFSRVWLCATP